MMCAIRPGPNAAGEQVQGDARIHTIANERSEVLGQCLDSTSRHKNLVGLCDCDTDRPAKEVLKSAANGINSLFKSPRDVRHGRQHLEREARDVKTG